MMEKRILHLTLHKEPFELIASGIKKSEDRDIKPYWTSRFFNSNGSMKAFDEVWFKNGYRDDSPFMRVVWKDLIIPKYYSGKPYYAIILGPVLEVRNWDGL